MQNAPHTQTIIGVDPGLLHAGWGVIRKQGNALFFVDCGTISVKANAALAERLHALAIGLEGVLNQHQPNLAAMEETFATPNGASTLKLGQARGALLVTLARHGLPVGEYAAKQVKKALTGTGRAEKHQLTHMVGMLLPSARAALAENRHDASDALAIAICHANSLR